MGAGRTRTAKIGTLGVLIADLDEDTGRPRKMTAYGPEGRASASFREITWKERDRRVWPDTFEFWAGDRRIWRETVTDADDRWVFGDPWFMPPDLMGRAIGEGKDAPVRIAARPRLRARRAPACTHRIEDAKRALVARWSELDRAMTAAGHELEESAALRLDAERRVIALEFRMPRGRSQRKERPPANWAPVEASSRWVVQIGEEPASMELAFGHLERLGKERRTIGHARLRIVLARSEDGPRASARTLEAGAVEQAAPSEAGDRRPDRR